MEPVEYLLEQLADETDARALRVLLDQAGELAGHPQVRAEALWWDARYTYMDRKKELLRDRFVWVLLITKNLSSSHPKRRQDPLVKEYREALCTPAFEAAMAADSRCRPRFYSAALLYVESIRERPAVMGIIRPGPDKDKASLNHRIAKELVDGILCPLALRCHGQPHVDELCRAVVDAARKCYPGIHPALEARVAECPHPEARDRVQAYLQE